MSVALLFLFSVTVSSEVTFNIGPKSVTDGESIRFEIRIEELSGRSPSFPDGLQPGPFTLRRSTPSVSTQQRYSNVTGMESFTTYTFELVPPSGEGTYVFPEQTLRYGGRDWTSPATEIAVVPKPKGRPDLSRSGPKVWLELALDKERYYIGEPIVLSVNIYHSRNVYLSLASSRIEMPDLGDFWVEEIETRSFDRESVRLDDQLYFRTLVIARLMYANKTGTLEIGAADAALALTVGRRLAIPDVVNIQSEPIRVAIEPLPSDGRPDAFSGLVGTFAIQSDIDRNRVNAGDSLALNISLEGLGNLAQVTDMKPTVSEGSFEIFDGGPPEVTRTQGIPRKKTWRYALVSSREGSHTITAPTLTYFDAEQGRYRETGGQTFTVEVLPGDVLEGGTTGPVVKRGADMQQSLSYIKMGPLGSLDERERLISPDRLAQLGGAMVALNLLLFFGLLWHQRNLSRQANSRPKFAFRNYRRAVSRLRARDEDSEVFYAGLSRAIFDFFGDKWDRPGQGISLDTIGDRFRRDQISEDLLHRVTEVIEACDLARFTPSSPSSRSTLLEKANEVVAELEEAL